MSKPKTERCPMVREIFFGSHEPVTKCQECDWEYPPLFIFCPIHGTKLGHYIYLGDVDPGDEDIEPDRTKPDGGCPRGVCKHCYGVGVVDGGDSCDTCEVCNGTGYVQ